GSLRKSRLEAGGRASCDNFVLESCTELTDAANPRFCFQALQADLSHVGQRMFRRQYRHQRFEPKRLNIDCRVHNPRRMQQAEVELPSANRLKPPVAMNVFQEYFNVRIRSAKSGGSVWDHAHTGDGHEAEPNTSDLALTRTLGGAHSVGSVVQDDA